MNKTYIVRTKPTTKLKVVANIVDVITPGSAPTIVNSRDSLVERTTGASTVREFHLEVINALGEIRMSVGSMVNLEQDGMIFRSTANGGGSRWIGVADGINSDSTTITPYVLTGHTHNKWQSHHAGSLGAHMTEQVISRVLPGKSLNRLSVYDPNTSTFTPNPDFWLSDVDLSCIPVHNSVTGRKYLGCLVTPKHMIIAAHAPLPQSSTCTFINTLGNKITMNVGSIQKIGVTGDFAIAHMVGAATNITPCKLFRNYDSRYVSPNSLCIAGNRLGEMIARMSSGVVSVNRKVDTELFTNPSNLSEYTKDLVSGDSGSPLIYIINGQPALIGTHYTSVTTGVIPHDLTQLEVAGQSGTFLPLEDIDVSSFPTY